MRLNLFSILLLGFFSFSCKKAEKAPSMFKIPHLIFFTQPDSLRAFEKTALAQRYNIIVGVYPFVDSINFFKNQQHLLFHPLDEAQHSSQCDTLTSDGLELFPDYSTTVYYPSREGKTAHYPVYLVNNTLTPKAIYGKDIYVKAIQEAQDSTMQWYPIETQAHWACTSWCGRLNPQTFAFLLFPKYQGNYKTRIRVRVRNRSLCLKSL